MEDEPDPYFALANRLGDSFRGNDGRDWAEWQQIATEDAAGIPRHATRAHLIRVKASHRGICECKELKDLIAGSVDQAYLDEICTLNGLERLDLSYPVTARNFDGLRSLTRLRHLSIDSPRNVVDFSPLLELPSLKTLIIENAKHLPDIEWLADAHHLEVIGIEGSIWTMQKVPSLAPLAGLANLRALLMTSVRLGDKDLFPLAECPRLEYLACARFAPRAEFEMLQRLKPDLVCTWFHPESWDLSVR